MFRLGVLCGGKQRGGRHHCVSAFDRHIGIFLARVWLRLFTAVMATSELSNADIADALKRARELAAGNRDENVKRPLDDSSDGESPAKRPNNMDHMDLAGNPIAAIGGFPSALPGMDPVIVEQFEVPDNCVGLIIGRGGESVSNIQNQSGCRVQMSPLHLPDSAPYQGNDGKMMRSCTLTGTKAAIERAKEMVQMIVDRADGTSPPPRNMGIGGLPPPGGSGRVITHEMLIPAIKCGLIIGKGGETIRNMQDKAGVKMVMVQDNTGTTGMPKPLRLIGEPDKVEYAKRLVEEIMASKDDSKVGGGGGGGGGGMMNDFSGGMPKTVGEVVIIVPRSAVGVIIGRGGENIRRLTADTGAKIQFKQGEDQTAPERTAVITGTTDQIQKATQLITDMVNRSVAGGGDGVGGNGAGGGVFRQGGEADIFFMHVPSTKTGLVIGKGGETIKQICAESGAKVELSREPPPSEFEKIFVIRGTSQQIHHAQHLIKIRVGDIPANTPVPPFPGAEQQFGYPTNYGSPGLGDPNAAAAWAYYQQYYQQNAGAQNYPASAGGALQQQPQSTSASSAPTINPQTGQPDYSAQWAEYYRSLGMHEQAAMIEQQAGRNAAAAVVASSPQATQSYGYGQPQSPYGYGQQPGGAGAAAGQYQYPTQ